MMLKRLNTKVKSYNEYLRFSPELYTIIDEISNRDKGDIVASLLMKLAYSSLYREDINFIGIVDQVNMLSYLPSKGEDNWGVDNEYNIEYDSKLKNPKRIQLRIGRLIKKLFNSIDKNLLEVEYDGPTTVNSYPYSSEIIIPEYYEFLVISGVTKVDYILQDGDDEYRETGIQLDSRISIKDDTRLIFKHAVTKKSILPKSSWQLFGSSKNISSKIRIYTNLSITDAQIERFFNNCSGLIKATRIGEYTNFEMVSGNDIKKYYNNENYQIIFGPLGTSCMSIKGESRFFDLYAMNPKKISLLILRNKSTDKIIGRSLIWKLDDGKTFMDRVYALNETDEKLYVQYAIDNSWIYRSNNKNCIYYFKGKEIDKLDISVKLDTVYLPFYPYLDTFRYLNLDNKTIYNSSNHDYDYELTSTQGKWFGYEKDDD